MFRMLAPLNGKSNTIYRTFLVQSDHSKNCGLLNDTKSFVYYHTTFPFPSHLRVSSSYDCLIRFNNHSLIKYCIRLLNQKKNKAPQKRQQLLMSTRHNTAEQLLETSYLFACLCVCVCVSSPQTRLLNK